jgi:hypothetical protein
VRSGLGAFFDDRKIVAVKSKNRKVTATSGIEPPTQRVKVALLNTLSQTSSLNQEIKHTHINNIPNKSKTNFYYCFGNVLRPDYY